MGVDAADYNRSGRPHLLVSNFQNQMLALYRNEGGGLFGDVAPASPVGRASMATLGFGAFFFDYDLDGWIDVLATNGHIEESVTTVQPKVQFKQPPLFFRNVGKGRFENASPTAGPDFAVPQAGARRRVRRLRPRRRPRRAVRQQPRAGPDVAQRGGQPQQLDLRARLGHKGQSKRHRRRRARHQRPRHAVADGAQRVELLLAERSGSDLWAGQRHGRHFDRRRVARRPEGDREEHSCEDVS